MKAIFSFFKKIINQLSLCNYILKITINLKRLYKTIYNEKIKIFYYHSILMRKLS